MVRTFCRWLVAERLLRRDPTAGIGRVRQPRQVPRGLTADRVSALWLVLPDVRAELIVTLMVQEGLRCGEVARLEVGDLDWAGRVVLVHGKGGHERVLPLSAQTAGSLSRYLSERPATAGPLVRSYTRPGQAILPGRISHLVGRWMRDAGVAASGHALRHTAATDMLRAGAHVRDVQTALGHASLATTQRYMPWVVGDLRVAMGGRQYGVSG